MMKVIYNESTRPSFNLALEEYLLKSTDDEYFMLWRNENCIVVGKNQNTHSEINFDFVKQNDISVIRRLTGGGAVFHDLGNMNFTFIERSGDINFNNYEFFTRPIINVLKNLDIPAELSGRNDLLIDDKKFSGNAQYSSSSGMLHHGTLLFASDVANLTQALNVNPLKIQSKGIKSVRSRVTNISEYLKKPLTLNEFAGLLIDEIFKTHPNASLYSLTKNEIEQVEALEKEKYSTWEWNFGCKQQFTFTKEKLLSTGIIEVNLNIENNKIEKVRFFGDYFGKRDVCELENALISTEYKLESILNVLNKFDISDFFTGTTAEQLLEIMM